MLAQRLLRGLTVKALMGCGHQHASVIKSLNMAYMFLQRFAEHCDDVMALGVSSTEALRPPDEDTVVNVILPIKK